MIANCVVIIQHRIVIIVLYRVEVGLGRFLKNIVILFAVKQAAASQCKLVTLFRMKNIKVSDFHRAALKANAHLVLADGYKQNIENIRYGKFSFLLASQNHFCWTNFHIYHIWCRTIGRNLVCSRFFHHERSKCSFRLETADTPGIWDTLRATRDRVQLVEYTGHVFGRHILRTRTAAAFLQLMIKMALNLCRKFTQICQ